MMPYTAITDHKISTVSLRSIAKIALLSVSLPLLAACGGGGGGGSSVPPPAAPADTTPPTIAFSATTLDIAPNTTAISTLTFSDNVGVVGTPTVSCTNNGTFAANVFTAPNVTTVTTSVCTATATDAAGNSATATLTVTVDPALTGGTANITLSGLASYDSVPFNTATNGLNYAATTQKPIRGATVEAINASGTVLATGQTDASGNYSLSVPGNTDMRVRVRSELISTAAASWDVKVTDNTSGNSVYALQGALSSSGSADQVRNLNAASGWGGAGYTSTRAAAPFAILDPIYESVTAFVAIDPNIDFPPVELRWSTLNRAENGDLTTGQIGTSSYRREAGQSQGNIYILGDENEDTDEYDSHVVVHEWGHYFEDQLSRSDSIGGPHSGGDRLDPRLALGEGFGNALSGMILGDPVYRDSSGTNQAVGFSIDVERNNVSNPGWFSEGSTQSILYDLFDSTDDGADTLSLGLGPIYRTLTANDYVTSNFFTTIFLFADEMRTQEPAQVTAIDALISAQSINGNGPNGAGETNSGSTSNALPLYKAITVNGGALNICSIVPNGAVNKLGIRNYLTLTIPSNGTYNFTMTRTSGLTNRDPDFDLYQNENLLARGISGDADTETLTRSLSAGDYIVDAYEFNNVADTNAGESCFNFTVTG